MSLITGLRDGALDKNSKKWLFIIFSTFYGSLLIFDEGRDAGSHYTMLTTYYADLSFQEFSDDLYEIITFKTPGPGENRQQDVLSHLSMYIIGSILGFPGLFFGFLGFVYGFFFASSVCRLVNLRNKINYKWLFYGFLSLFILFLFIHKMQSVRTWTACWILFYAVLSYLDTGKRKYLFLTLIPPLIHVAFFVMAIPAWLVLAIGNWKKTFFIVYVISFFAQLIPEPWVLKQFSNVPLGADKVQSYHVEDQKEYLKDQRTKVKDSRFYVQYKKLGYRNWAIYVCIYVLAVSGTFFYRMNNTETTLFSISMLSVTLSNFTFFIYALTNRQAIVGTLFLLAALVSLLQRNHLIFITNLYNYKLDKYGLKLSLILFIPLILLKFSDFLNYASTFLLAFPFAGWILPEFNDSIKEILRHLLL